MTYSLNDAFEDASLVSAAPHYSQIAAALPERERERFVGMGLALEYVLG